MEITLFRKGRSKDGTTYVVVRKDVETPEGVKTLSAIMRVGDDFDAKIGTKYVITSKMDKMIEWQGYGKKRKYKSHCFICRADINSEDNPQCEDCLRYRCNYCGRCYCNYPG